MWGTLIAQFVGQATKPITVVTPTASQFQPATDPTFIIGTIAGIAVIGGALYWTLK